MGVYEGGSTGSGNTHTPQIISGGKKMAGYGKASGGSAKPARGASTTTSGKAAPVKIAKKAAGRKVATAKPTANPAKMRGSKVSGGNFGQNNG